MTVATWVTALALSLFMDARQAGAGHTVLRSVRLEQLPDGVALTIEANGPLPMPRVGVLQDPPRIYVDLADVAPSTTRGIESPNALVRRVRIAVNQPDPLVTRVVIDLSQPLPHRIDAGDRAAGRIRILLGDHAPSDVRPVVPVSKPVERPPAQPGGQRQNNALAAAAGRLDVLRPLLVSIDTRADVPDASLRAALTEFAAIRQTLTSLRKSEAQDALIKACVFGATAVDARIEAQQRGDAARAWTAASAAAGALMTLDRIPKPH